jgi:RNA polymerase sigma factor (sigma-70 family)
LRKKAFVMPVNFDAPVATPERFAELVEQFRPLLFQAAIQTGWRQAKNPPADQIEDVIQTAITAVYEHGPWRTIPAPATLQYLKKAVTNHTLNHLRNQRSELVGKAKAAAEAAGVESRGYRVQAPRPFTEDRPVQPVTPRGMRGMLEPINSPLRDHVRLQPNTVEDDQLASLNLSGALGKLPAEQADLLRLHYLEGHTLPELVKEMGIPRATLNRQLKEARAALKSLLAEAEPV